MRVGSDLRLEGSLMRCEKATARWSKKTRKSIAQEIVLKSTDFLRRITVPVEGQGGVT